MNRALLRTIPSVDKILHALGDTGLPHPIVVDVVRREIAALRKGKTIPKFDALLTRLHDTFRELRASRIQPLINGTGILIHTNFGRAEKQATQLICQFIRDHGPATVSDLRQTIGSSRRVIIPLLERLDRAGVTERVDDKRALRQRD